jgi:hypothetical protein
MFGRSTVWRNALANCPAGIDAVADAEQSVDAIFVTIDPGRLALAAAEDAALEVQLMERSQATTGPSRSCLHPGIGERKRTYERAFSGTRLRAVSLPDWLPVIP